MNGSPRNNKKRLIVVIAAAVFFVVLVFVAFVIFFDQAILVRRGTIFRASCPTKIVALTFDDGPSPVWTPQILDELKKAGVKATFFVLGEHVARYPSIARRIVEEGHEIENHSYDHHVLLYYKPEEIRWQIKDTEKVIKDVTGVTTKFFRPPKALLTAEEKKIIKTMGYQTVLWSLNSKDWVLFDDKYMIRYLLRHIRPGDIILFHDSGGALSAEGGSRHETVLAVMRLIERLKERGYQFMTVDELLRRGCYVQ